MTYHRFCPHVQKFVKAFLTLCEHNTTAMLLTREILYIVNVKSNYKKIIGGTQNV
jgi:hypothetical protein